MSEKAIVGKILSDAEEEARAIIAEAEERAAETVARAAERAERNKKGAEQEAAARGAAIRDGKAATARLDCAKILLGEKRGVIDEIYARALKELNGLSKAESLRLAEKLLKSFAETGDEIVFAANYGYAADVAKLSVVRERKLKASPKSADLDGGFVLRGKSSDKNLSYGALLAEDREAHQAEIAAKIFVTD